MNLNRRGEEERVLLSGETGRQRYHRQINEIRTELGISHTEARGRWHVYYEKGGKSKRAIKQVILAVRASTSDTRVCPFCRDSIYHPDDGGGQDHVCSSCQAHYHLDCYEEELGGRCATLGCAARRAVTHVRARGRIRVTQVPPPTPVTRTREHSLEVQEIPPETGRDWRRGPPPPIGPEGLLGALLAQNNREAERVRLSRPETRLDPSSAPESLQPQIVPEERPGSLWASALSPALLAALLTFLLLLLVKVVG